MQHTEHEGPQEHQGGSEPTQMHPRQPEAERGQEHQDRSDQHAQPAQTHAEPLPTPDAQYAEPDPLDAPEATGGACRCPSAAAHQSAKRDLRQLDCTCAWNEVVTAVTHLAYGDLSDDELIAFAAVVAAMVHDAAYRSRDSALARRLSVWPGTRRDFAVHHGLNRSRLYQLGIHRQSA